MVINADCGFEDSKLAMPNFDAIPLEWMIPSERMSSILIFSKMLIAVPAIVENIENHQNTTPSSLSLSKNGSFLKNNASSPFLRRLG